MPAVEFGPVGAGHHGPEEWVSISSLHAYRQTLETFLRLAARPDRGLSDGRRARVPASRRPEGDGTEPPPKPKRYWWRFLLGSVLIVAAVAAATAASASSSSSAASPTPSPTTTASSKAPALPRPDVNGGEPENILILGSDKRANEPADPGRSDTTILLRLDPDRNAIALMSIPRDLKVEIPGYGTEKFNAAYTYGGPKLTLQVVKELTGLPINHVVNVDYLGFVRAVDAIGCVYVDVDRRYYHSNAECRPPKNMRKSTSSRAISCSAGKRRCSTSATGTPTPIWSAPRASRTSSAPPASGCRSATSSSIATSCSTSSPNTRPPTSATARRCWKC